MDILNRYRALADGWSPHERGSRTQENYFLPLPEGHGIAPDDEFSREVRCCAPKSPASAARHIALNAQVISKHPWHTRVMVVAGGCGYYTSSNSDAGGKFGSGKTQSCMLLEIERGPGQGALYSVFTSSLGILIRTPISALQ